jgi:hypothetical protein
MICVPLFMACGAHQWSAETQYPLQHGIDEFQTNGDAIQPNPSEEQNSDTRDNQHNNNVHTSHAAGNADACSAFRAHRSRPEPKPEGVILAVSERNNQQLIITPLRWQTGSELEQHPSLMYTDHPIQRTHIALDGWELYVAYAKDVAYAVERRSLFTGSSAVYKRAWDKDRLDSLSASNGYCYLGSDGRQVEVVDFYQHQTPLCALPKPESDTPVGATATLDKLALSAGSLLALNDTPVIKLVFGFQLNNNGLGQYRFTAQLPFRNELKYRDLAVTDEYFVVYGNFQIPAVGAGHILSTYSMAAEGLIPVGTYEEVAPARSDGQDNQIESWQGLGMIDNRIFIGSSKRGIQSFDVQFSFESRKEWNLGGDCTDIKIIGQQIFALVQTAERENNHTQLVVLNWNRDTQQLSVVAKYHLNGQPNRFVR